MYLASVDDGLLCMGLPCVYDFLILLNSFFLLYISILITSCQFYGFFTVFCWSYRVTHLLRWKPMKPCWAPWKRPLT